MKMNFNPKNQPRRIHAPARCYYLLSHSGKF